MCARTHKTLEIYAHITVTAAPPWKWQSDSNGTWHEEDTSLICNTFIHNYPHISTVGRARVCAPLMIPIFAFRCFKNCKCLKLFNVHFDFLQTIRQNLQFWLSSDSMISGLIKTLLLNCWKCILLSIVRF